MFITLGYSRFVAVTKLTYTAIACKRKFYKKVYNIIIIIILIMIIIKMIISMISIITILIMLIIIMFIILVFIIMIKINLDQFMYQLSNHLELYRILIWPDIQPPDILPIILPDIKSSDIRLKIYFILL